MTYSATGIFFFPAVFTSVITSLRLLTITRSVAIPALVGWRSADRSTWVVVEAPAPLMTGLHTSAHCLRTASFTALNVVRLVSSGYLLATAHRHQKSRHPRALSGWRSSRSLDVGCRGSALVVMAVDSVICRLTVDVFARPPSLASKPSADRSRQTVEEALPLDGLVRKKNTAYKLTWPSPASALSESPSEESQKRPALQQLSSFTLTSSILTPSLVDSTPKNSSIPRSIEQLGESLCGENAILGSNHLPLLIQTLFPSLHYGTSLRWTNYLGKSWPPSKSTEHEERNDFSTC